MENGGKNMTEFQSTQKMKFNKTETEYNMKSIRFLLLTITTMFIVIAGLMIVMGLSVYAHYHDFSFFYDSAKSGKFFTPSIMCVLLGLAIMVVTSFGFFGTLKQSTCLVNLYAFILILVLIVKLVVVILAFTMDTNTIMDYIDIPIRYINDPEVQDEIDRLQVNLNCCGSSNFLDYIGAPLDNVTTVAVRTDIDGDLVSITIPESCCITATDYVCTRVKSIGCKEALVNLIVQNSSVLGVLGVSVMFIQLLGIIFALLLARCIRKLKSERAFLSWVAKEQTIYARQVAEAQEKDANIVYIDRQDSSVA